MEYGALLMGVGETLEKGVHRQGSPGIELFNHGWHGWHG
jgi:hypothetical protein